MPASIKEDWDNEEKSFLSQSFSERAWWSMLVLRRQAEESIDIGGGIKVCILSIEGDNVKIGIEAPRDVPVYRSEIKSMMDKSRNVQAKSGCGAWFYLP